MKLILPMIAFSLLVAQLVCAESGIEQHPEILPTKVFHALEAGKPQTVVLYGTSVTIKGQWAKEVKAYFETLYPGQITFNNNAKSGMHSGWGVANLKQRVLDKRPDLVFVELAINDAAANHDISVEDCRDNLDAMVKSLRRHNPQVEIVLQTMNPAWDSPKVAKNYASDRPDLEQYYEVYRRYAHANDLTLVDNYPVWKEILDNEPERFRKMVSDGIHPHSAPSREIAWLTVKAMLDKARALAGGEQMVRVWPAGKMPGQVADSPETLRSPARIDAIRVTNVSEPTLTLFPAKDGHGAAPAMIVCPGGGYGYVVVDKEGSEIAGWLNSLGIHAVVLKYRVPKNRKGALQDLQRSLSLVRARAVEWDIDPSRVGVIGFSAGGHLCARASTQFGNRNYSPIDTIDRFSCRPALAVLVYPAYLERDGQLATELDLKADIPPTLIVHSDDDKPFAPGSRRYVAALDATGVVNEFLNYATGGHGYGLRSTRDARAWPDDARRWLIEQGFANATRITKASTTKLD